MLVSAAIADGPPRRILDIVADGQVRLVMPEPVPAELRRVLGKKLGLDPPAVERVLGLLDELSAELAEVPDDVEAITGDPDDDLILAASLAAGADVLISGDSTHMLPLGEHRGMRIMRPQALLAEITHLGFVDLQPRGLTV